MRKKLGEILVASGAVKRADVDGALSDQSAGEPSRLGDILVALGKITPTQLAHALALQYELPFVEVPEVPAEVLALVPAELQREYRFVPFKRVGAELYVAMADLSNLEVVTALESQWARVHVSVAASDEIDTVLGLVPGVAAPPAIPPVPRGEVGPIDALLSDLGLVPAPAPPAAELDDLFGDLNLGAEPEPPPSGVKAAPTLTYSGLFGDAAPVVVGQALEASAARPAPPVGDATLAAAGDDEDAPITGSLALPEWLRDTEPVPAPAAAQGGHGPGPGWTGALDHLAPSKLVLGLARALIARGLVTEQDILDALGPPK